MKRLDYLHVKHFFEKNGCFLISKEYNNARSKLSYYCHCGNKSEIIFDSFRKGSRCKKCRSKTVGDKCRFSFDYVKEYFYEQKCELLENDYINNSIPLNYVCSCNNKGLTNFNHFRQGRRCNECSRQQRSGPNNWKWIPDRSIVDLKRKIQNKCTKMLSRSMSIKKSDSTISLLGYSRQDLLLHITSHPNWESCKSKNWSIDHIFPVKAFVIDYGIRDLKLINSLDNLQPLELIENIKKSDNYNKDDFDKWLKTKGFYGT